jgi:hypothetical protein
LAAPSLTDRIVEVSAYLTDETFGYVHWRAAQFEERGREAVLVICREGESRAELLRRIDESLWSVYRELDDDEAPPPHVRLLRRLVAFAKRVRRKRR